MRNPAFNVQVKETVYSLLTRYYLLTGHYNYTNLLNAVFGSTKIRIHPYLPSHLNAVSKEISITPSELLANHTLYPLFAFFAQDNKQLAEAMLGDKQNSVHAAYLPSFKLSIFCGHKYCPLCVKADSQRYGCPIWHVYHQIPGVTACHLHACKLKGISNQDKQIDRKLVLPPLRDATFEMSSKIETDLAHFSVNLMDLLKERRIPKVSFISIYKVYLSEKGFITKKGHLRYTQLVKVLSQYWQELPYGERLCVPEALRDFSFIGPLLRGKECPSKHPIQHLLFACWLFDKNAECFFLPIAEDYINIVPLKIRDDSVIIQLLNGRKSMAYINLVTGKSRCYIRRVAEINGISHETNMQAYSSNIRYLVVLQAQLGRHRQCIANTLNVGMGYVEQVIGNTFGLSKWRKLLIEKKKTCKAQNELLNARSLHSNWIRKDFKTQHNQAFFYLYNHSRSLLESILPPPKKNHYCSRDWSKEDQRLYDAVLKIKAVQSMSLSAICQAINDRGHIKRKLESLPKTKALLIKLGKI